LEVELRQPTSALPSILGSIHVWTDHLRREFVAVTVKSRERRHTFSCVYGSGKYNVQQQGKNKDWTHKEEHNPLVCWVSFVELCRYRVF
jgi:hypothetical protein